MRNVFVCGSKPACITMSGSTVEAHGFQPCDQGSKNKAASAAVDNLGQRA